MIITEPITDNEAENKLNNDSTISCVSVKLDISVARNGEIVADEGIVVGVGSSMTCCTSADVSKHPHNRPQVVYCGPIVFFWRRNYPLV